MDYRADHFNPTLTLAVRIDAIDNHTKKPVVVGYSLLPAFLEPENQKQPTRTNAQDMLLNSGAFQLPIYTGITSSGEFNANACDSFLKLPCSTVLVRVVLATKSDDGTNLSRTDFPKSEWISRGVVEPRPKYESGVYDSVRSRPTQTEKMVYGFRKERENLPITKALSSVVDDTEQVEEWLQNQLAVSFNSRVAY